MKKIIEKYSYAILLIILSCSLAFILSLRFNSNVEEKFVTIMVSEGDSLWKISTQYSNQHSYSNNEFVSWVKQHNNIEGDRIYPGDEITIPVNLEAGSLTEYASAGGE
ncbi:LysM peptidoglycan-binding domain-containing protein [Bacillus sp. EB106-08-02-XG196]|uniref:cell division suppressor protein YneA n=1 Tax=Bacillus sp. EB106-08-02-XG196 TaxID=2737049 RepID=UPI0015C4AAC6|nr:LysM peptidoglycan-binding domain-containing protein [Bacillus sp. EB106-08-02-XG196]NWQ40414.1 LysM peptidoglycan-binding domain-containing protein [Bacillus sp. EB106-08-02-XG196]